MIVVVLIGMLAALAIPAFQKVRNSSQERAVMNNLRQLSGAADQYFLENGVTSVATATLVGTYTSQYLKTIAPVGGETYVSPLMQGSAVTASGLAGGRTITFSN